MASFVDQIDRLAFNALNGGTGDPVPGQPNSPVSGLLTVPYDGQLGKRCCVTGIGPGPESTRLSNTTIGTLYGGIYQYVQFYLSSTATVVRGGLVVWYDPANAIVTPDVADTTWAFAGVALNAVAKGNYGWIQIAGIASVLFGTTTKATPAAGDLVVLASASSLGKGDVLADATSLTGPLAKCIIGRARKDGVYTTAPVSATISQVVLWPSLGNAIF